MWAERNGGTLDFHSLLGSAHPPPERAFRRHECVRIAVPSEVSHRVCFADFIAKIIGSGDI